METAFINECLSHVKQFYLSSTRYYFKRNPYYDELPPRIKTKLIRVLLPKHREVFAFFFEDYLAQTKAPSAFITEVLSNLDSELYTPGKTIISYGEQVHQMVLV